MNKKIFYKLLNSDTLNNNVNDLYESLILVKTNEDKYILQKNIGGMKAYYNGTTTGEAVFINNSIVFDTGSERNNS